MKRLLLLGLVLTLAGCGVDVRTTAPAATSGKAVAQQRTTVQIGPTDLVGQIVTIQPGSTDYTFTIRPEGRTETVQVLVPATMHLRVVRGNFAGTGSGLPLTYLYEKADVRINLVSKTGSPLRAREIFWDMTGIPM